MIPIKSQISNILQQTYPLNSSVHNSFSPACTADAQQKRQALLQAPSLQTARPLATLPGRSARSGQIRPQKMWKSHGFPRNFQEYEWWVNG